MKYIIAAMISLGVSPLTAMAQEHASPFSYSGVVKIENLSVNNHPKTFGFAQFDLGYLYPLSDGLKFGAEVGVDAVQQAGQRGDAVFAAAVLDSPYGKLSLGLPRLVIPQVFDTPAIGGSEVAQLVAGIFTGEILSDANLLKHAPLLRGVRYDATFGKVTVAVALHEYDNSSSPLRQIAVTYDGGDWSATLGGQGINVGPTKEHQVKLALRAKHDKFSGGVVATRQFIGHGRENTLEVFGGYDVTDRVRVEAQVFDVVVNNDATLALGLDATYTMPSGVFVQAGLARTDAKRVKLLDGTLINVGLGYKF